MARSRYSETDVLDGHFYATFSLPTKARGLREVNLLDGVRVVEHRMHRSERLDHVAAKFWGEDQYWWVLALVNNISYPLGIAPGRKLKVPVNVQDVLQKLFSS